MPTPRLGLDGDYSKSTKRAQCAELNNRHRALMRKLAAGVPPMEAAAQLGMSKSRVSVVSHSPVFQQAYKEMQANIDKDVEQMEVLRPHMDGGIRAQLEQEANASLRTIVNLRDGGTSERVRQVSALEILDRGGYGKSPSDNTAAAIETTDGVVNAINIAIGEMHVHRDGELEKTILPLVNVGSEKKEKKEKVIIDI